MANKKLLISTPKGDAYQMDTKAGKIKIAIEWKQGYGPQATQGMQTAQTEFSNECLRLCDKYVPKDTGMLIASALLSSRPEDGLLVWNTPYAAQQYYRQGIAGSQTGGMRGSHWGERMKADNLDHLREFLKKRVEEAF